MTDFSVLESVPFPFYFYKNLEVQSKEKFLGRLVCPMPGLDYVHWYYASFLDTARAAAYFFSLSRMVFYWQE